jgi:hypothetical protein
MLKNLTPISEKVIREIDKFLSACSEPVLDDYKREFNLQQPYVYLYVKDICENLNNESKSIIFWKLALLIDLSYNTYDLPKEVILMNDITEQMILHEKLMDELNNIHKNRNGLPEIMSNIEQDNLMIYTGEQINNYYEQGSLFNLFEIQELLSLLMILGYVYQSNYKSKIKFIQN